VLTFKLRRHRCQSRAVPASQQFVHRQRIGLREQRAATGPAVQRRRRCEQLHGFGDGIRHHRAEARSRSRSRLVACCFAVCTTTGRLHVTITNNKSTPQTRSRRPSICCWSRGSAVRPDRQHLERADERREPGRVPGERSRLGISAPPSNCTTPSSSPRQRRPGRRRPLPTAVYTEVQWTALGSLGIGASMTLQFVVAIPIRGIP